MALVKCGVIDMEWSWADGDKVKDGRWGNSIMGGGERVFLKLEIAESILLWNLRTLQADRLKVIHYLEHHNYVGVGIKTCLHTCGCLATNGRT